MSQWVRLAFVGVLAGELTSGGCSGSRSFRSSQSGGHAANLPHIDPGKLGQYVGLIVLTVLAAFVLFFVLLYVSSVFRFILFESVVRKKCSIGQAWDRWQAPGRRYFLWQIVFQIAFGIVFAIMLGGPVGFAAAAGWLLHWREHLVLLVLGGIALFFCVLSLVLVAAVIHVMAKDFLVPVMALENLDFAEGWNRVLDIASREKGSFAIYILLKVGLALAAAVLFGIISVIVSVIVLIPAGIIGVAAVMMAKSAGMGWNVFTITAAIVAASIVLAILLYLMSLVSVPAIVFFPAYSIYFFSSRYPGLAQMLYSPAPIVEAT